MRRNQRFASRLSVSLKRYIKSTGDIWFSTSIGVLELLTGLVSAFFLLPLAGRAPWILSVFPVMLTVRGANNGIFSGVLTTSLYLGTIEPKFRGNSEHYYSLISAVYNLSLVNTFIAIFILAFFLMNPLLVVLGYLIIVTTSAISVTFSILATSFVGFTAYRMGLNPDDVVYPIMSTINDIMISVFLSFSVSILEPWRPNHALEIGSPILLIVIAFNYVLHIKFRANETYRRVTKEGQLGIFYAVSLSSFSGIFMAESYSLFKRNPILLVILPFLMTALGDAGSIMVSRLTTSLHIGEVDYNSFSDVLRSTAGSLLLVIPPFVTITALIVVFSTAFLSNISLFLPTIIIAFALSYTVLLLEVPLVIIISTQTFKYGFNPDNFAIPIVTSSADFLSVFLINAFSFLM